MARKACKSWLIVPILAVALCTAGVSMVEEEAPPKTFNSEVAFDVYAVTGGVWEFVGQTPSKEPLTISPCDYWLVEPRSPVDMKRVRKEVAAQGIPVLLLGHATDADLEHLKGLSELQHLNLTGTKVTDAGLEHLKGLTALRGLDLGLTQVTDAGVAQLKESLPNVRVVR